MCWGIGVTYLSWSRAIEVLTYSGAEAGVSIEEAGSFVGVAVGGAEGVASTVECYRCLEAAANSPSTGSGRCRSGRSAS